MGFDDYRNYLGKFVLITNITLFLLILVLFAVKGFTSEELTELFKYLVPIKALYLTALVKFILKQQKNPELLRPINQNIQPLFKTLTKLVFYVHIGSLYIFILLSAFNAISFDFLIGAIIALETFFGIYIGLIIDDLFGKSAS